MPLKRTSGGEKVVLGIPKSPSPAFLRSAVMQALADRFRPPAHTVTAELRFRQDRRDRWDLAVLPEKVAIEFQGGTYIQGRHVRGAGYRRDAEKFLAGAADGWVVIPLTYDQLEENLGEVIGSLIHVIEGRRAK